MVVLQDRSYDDAKTNMDSKHYGTKGLQLASDKTIAKALYDPIIYPFNIKAMCVAVKNFGNQRNISYSTEINKYTLQSLFKAFVTSIISDNRNTHTTECCIHIGNIGCGVFGHNYNTIFILQHLAANLAITVVKPRKKITLLYHAYDEKTYNGLHQIAIPALVVWIYAGKSFETIMMELRKKQIEMPNIWEKKI